MGEGFNFGWTIPLKILGGFVGRQTNSEEGVAACFFQLRDLRDPKWKPRSPFFQDVGEFIHVLVSSSFSGCDSSPNQTRPLVRVSAKTSQPRPLTNTPRSLAAHTMNYCVFEIVLITFAEARGPSRHHVLFTLSHAAKIPALNHRWLSSDRFVCFTSETLFSSTFRKTKWIDRLFFKKKIFSLFSDE